MTVNEMVSAALKYDTFYGPIDGIFVDEMSDSTDLLSLRHLAASVSARVGGSLFGLLHLFFSQDTFDAGLEQVLNAGKVQVGQRTFLDALTPSIRLLSTTNSSTSTLEDIDTWKNAASAARSGADSTRSMQAVVGRASRVHFDAYRGFEDPGAEAVAVFFEGVLWDA